MRNTVFAMIMAMGYLLMIPPLSVDQPLVIFLKNSIRIG